MKIQDIEAQRSLSDKDLSIFNAELQRQSKSTGIAYLLWFFLGGFGIHKFYMGYALAGLFYMACTFVGGFFFFADFVGLAAGSQEGGKEIDLKTAVVGLLPLFLLAVFLLLDLFTISGQLQKREKKLRKKLLKTLGALAQRT